jgi:hypothetical protein
VSGRKVKKFKSQYKSKFIGDLWVFEYDYFTDTGIVKGSDVDWENYAVIEGEALWLVLAEDERAWLKSSWEAATKHLSNPGIYLGLDTKFVQDKRKCYLTNDYCPICLKQKREFADHHCIAKVDGGTDDYFNILRICCTCHAIIHSGSVEDRVPKRAAARNHQLMYFGSDFCALDSLEEDSHESRYRLEHDPSLERLVAAYKSCTEADREKADRFIKDRARLEYQYYRDVARGERFTDDWLRRLERRLELVNRHGWPP